MVYYTASKSRSQGRKSYSIIFRHPVVKDSKCVSGLRIRRGLGTANSEMADKLVDQMNNLLKDKSLWDICEKDVAKKLYDPIIIAAFYDPLEIIKDIPFVIVYESGLGKGWDIVDAIDAKWALKKFKEIEPDIYKLCKYPYGKIYIAKLEKVVEK
jgi:hypothetical protein